MEILHRLAIAIICGLIAAVIVSFLYFGVSITSIVVNALLFSSAVALMYSSKSPLSPNRYRELHTLWTEQVDTSCPHPEYPRPQFIREAWQNLNGQWDYAIQAKEVLQPKQYDGKILVPFPVESLLSGVGKHVGEKNKLWYKRTFTAPESKHERLLLHFGAVDWKTEVWLNGQLVGSHQGGHSAFSFDITQYLHPEKAQELIVSVWDPSDKGPQPRGKQVSKPGNIFYTPVTGIWQTVWLEPVPQSSIESIKITPQFDESAIEFSSLCSNAQDGDALQITVLDQGQSILQKELALSEQINTLTIPNVKHWSPESPFLYDIKLTLLRDGKVLDQVSSYFGMRKIKIEKDQLGIPRIYLNNQATFQLGLLDQGWWPDGLYTPPTDEALLFDIEATQKMGFNVIRKHVKIESARWYSHCDRLGVLVWQDMPSGDKMILPKFQADITRSPESKRIYHDELDKMMEQLHFAPSIVVWVPLNEGWGQFETNDVIRKVQNKDPSRLTDGPSGWVDRGEGDMRDYHIYIKPFNLKAKPKRAIVVGEFGGLGRRLPQHMAVTNSWSYRNYSSPEALSEAYQKMFTRDVEGSIKNGLSGAIYTQTTDIESEINGLLTYDRKIVKIPYALLNDINQRIFKKFSEETTVL